MKAILWWLYQKIARAVNAAKWVPKAYLCREEVVYTRHGPRVTCELAAFMDFGPEGAALRWGTVTHLFPQLQERLLAPGWKITALTRETRA